MPFKLSQSVDFILISINFVSKSFNFTLSNNNFSNKINIFSSFTKSEIFLRWNCFVEEFWNTAFLIRFFILIRVCFICTFIQFWKSLGLIIINWSKSFLSSNRFVEKRFSFDKLFFPVRVTSIHFIKIKRLSQCWLQWSTTLDGWSSNNAQVNWFAIRKDPFYGCD